MPEVSPVEISLTFGIEAEFALRYVRSIDRKKSVEVKRTEAFRHVAETMRKAGFKVDELDLLAGKYDKWTIIEDRSVGVPNNWDWTNIEFRSRILKFDGTEGGLKEVDSFMTLLRDRYVLASVDTAGLHVHVGNGFLGFPLKTLQNLVLMQVGFEHLFAAMHPGHRILWPKHSAAYSCVRPSFQLYGREAGFERLCEIVRTTSLKELESSIQDQVGLGRDVCLNLMPLSNMTGRPQNHKRTVEFRQHTSSSDPVAIVSWVKVVCNLLLFSHYTPNAKMMEILNRCTDTQYGTLEMLHDIGCEDAVVGFYSTRLTTYSEDDIPWPKLDEHQKELFTTAMEWRDNVMHQKEALWARENKTNTLGLNQSFVRDNSIDMEDPWIYWDKLPFDRPWDERMAANVEQAN